MIVDHTATAVNLAKSILMGLDDKRMETPVQTQTLRLLLTALIELGAPKQDQALAEGARRTVLSGVSLVNGAASGRGN